VVDPTILEDLGLQEGEAKVYLALLRQGTLGAPALAEQTGTPRSSVYLIIRALTDKGLIEGGAGYGSRFRAIPPAKALGTLFQHERDAIARREFLADRVMPQLEALFQEAEGDPEEHVIEVLRSTSSIGERLERLQLEAEREIDVLVKAPAIATRAGNPAELRSLRRGVRHRGLYEEEVLETPEVRPHLSAWVRAGEEIGIYPGKLPLKMVMTDRRNVLIPLAGTGGREGITTLLIRHPSLGAALHMLFEHLWEQSRPFAVDDTPPSRRAGGASRPDRGRAVSRAGRTQTGTRGKGPKASQGKKRAPR
jgi:sugar-specific transcriptional regulator TrmB